MTSEPEDLNILEVVMPRSHLATACAALIVLAPMLGACTGADTPTTTPSAGTGSSVGPSGESGPQPGFELLRFSNPTSVDNRWFPLRPGTQFVYEGETVEDGRTTEHRVVSTVTDLVKVIAGVPNVVVWDRDFAGDELVEAEIAFFAQADDGDIWRFGEYPEAYEAGELVETPAWIHGIKDAQAGLFMMASPKVSADSYAQGWGPEVDWSDRAIVQDTGQEACVRAGCYSDVLITDEFSLDEPGAHQLKYYAPEVGNIQVGWTGDDPTQETLELVEIVQLSEADMAEVREEAMKLEEQAYVNSKEVYGRTTPMTPAE
ncbi:hypothetical protein [Agromyces neolithicus]|uniref:Lipoprotein n=1 Tax=Agromyces neolithicus TaxID=269420 RepID=A0ABN2M947_9MICO